MDPSVTNQQQKAAESTEDVWNFAFGANMASATLKRRKITVLEAEPACLKDWKLAFNLIGMPWMEPAFGNIVPSPGDVVHGVAIRMSATDFQRLMKEEGGASKGENSIYQVKEIEVQSYTDRSIKCWAFIHCNPHAVPRLPSERYATLLREGSREWKLDETYQRMLDEHPVNELTFTARMLAKLVYLLTVTPGFMLFRLCLRLRLPTFWFWPCLEMWSKILWIVHDLLERKVPPKPTGTPYQEKEKEKKQEKRRTRRGNGNDNDNGEEGNDSDDSSSEDTSAALAAGTSTSVKTLRSRRPQRP